MTNNDTPRDPSDGKVRVAERSPLFGQIADLETLIGNVRSSSAALWLLVEDGHLDDREEPIVWLASQLDYFVREISRRYYDLFKAAGGDQPKPA